MAALGASYDARASELLEKSRRDGGLSPAELEELKTVKGMSLLILSDHNEVLHRAILAGSAEAKKEAWNSIAQQAGLGAAAVAGVHGAAKPGKTVSQKSSGAQEHDGGPSVASEAKLQGKLVATEIAGGHAFDKHVVEQGEYQDIGIVTRKQFAEHIEKIVNKPSAVRQLGGGRTAYWDDHSGTVVIRNPKASDGGTAFRPTAGRAYFEGLK